MKVIIAGGRDFTDYGRLCRACDHLLSNQHYVDVVCGMAKGADKLGERYSHDKGFNIARFPADWDRFGKSAGYKRNAEMADYADSLIAFWDGKSKGTKNMIDLAKSKGLKVRVLKY